MPFESIAQAKWMFANKPKIAKKWVSHTESIKSLPNKKRKDSPRRQAKREGY